MTHKPRILLLSAYHADSHKYWCEGLMRELPDYQWVMLTLPARHFSWRIRSNSLSWAYGEPELLGQSYDLIIASSMVDLNSLRGLVPSLALVPAILYFHENQFEYPVRLRQQRNVEAKITSIFGALSAQSLVFNSHYNLRTFFSGTANFLKEMPDKVPPNIVEQLEAKACVVPVPLNNTCIDKVKLTHKMPISIVWNHRWEYDKGPDRLLALIECLSVNTGEGVKFCFHVVGQQFRNQPAEFQLIKQRLQCLAWLGQWGYVEDIQDYHQLLASSDIVLSTALHDFQGLSVIEAVARGCCPVLPDRMAYPDFFSKDYLYHSSSDVAVDAKNAADKILQVVQSGDVPIPSVNKLMWAHLAPEYKNIIDSLLACDK